MGDDNTRCGRLKMLKRHRLWIKFVIFTHVLLWSASIGWLGWILSADWQQIIDSFGYGLLFAIIPSWFVLTIALAPLSGSRVSIVTAGKADISIALIGFISLFLIQPFSQLLSDGSILLIIICSVIYLTGFILLRSQKAGYFDGYGFAAKGENKIETWYWPWGR